MAKVFGYKTYSFVDKDPVIGLLQTVIKEQKLEFREIADISGVSRTTIAKWFYGETRRPQHASVEAVARALGYEFRMVYVRNVATPELKPKGPRLVADNGHIKPKKPVKIRSKSFRGGDDAA